MDPTHQNEEKNKRGGAIFSGAYTIALLAVLIWPFLSHLNPPPGQEGIVVNLGIPDVGQGEVNAPIASSDPPVSEVEPEPIPEDTEPDLSEPEVEEPEPEPEVVKPKESKPAEKDLVKTEDPEALALKKKKEEDRKKREEEVRKQREEDRKKRAAEEAKKREEDRKKAEADQKRREEEARKKAEAEAKAKAEAEAKAKAEAEKKKYEDAKNKFGSLFGGGDGDGKGKTGNSGNQGDPGGDPNSSNLEGISTGSGRVGGGLGNRGIVASPGVTDDSQKTGRVVIRVCVDSEGTVTSARFTQKGSTTADPNLQAVAIKNAKAWKFSKGDVDEQCGTITYDFKLQ